MNQRVYLDHAATTPICPEALHALTEQLRAGGNPSSLHQIGRSARRAVETAREQLAQALNADPAEIIFTAGGTEADNLAIKGMYWKRQERDSQRRRIVVSSIEHHAVKDTVEWLRAYQGAEVDWLEVDAEGRINPDDLRTLLDQHASETALVTCMWANNEVGTVQPIREMAEIAAEYEVPFHTDAVQAFGAIAVDFRVSGATSLALSGHKIGAPMGIGALVATRTAPLTPLIHGGGQERDVRSGTINAPAIAGFGAAAVTASASRAEESARIRGMRDRLIAGVQERIPQAVLRGSSDLSESSRLPGNAHFTFPGCEGDSLLFLLDMAGIESSTGSACNAGVPRPSEVLLAMGLDEVTARGAQRFTLGHTSTDADVDCLLEALPLAYEQAVQAGMADHAPGTRWH